MFLLKKKTEKVSAIFCLLLITDKWIHTDLLLENVSIIPLDNGREEINFEPIIRLLMAYSFENLLERNKFS